MSGLGVPLAGSTSAAVGGVEVRGWDSERSRTSPRVCIREHAGSVQDLRPFRNARVRSSGIRPRPAVASQFDGPVRHLAIWSIVLHEGRTRDTERERLA